MNSSVMAIRAITAVAFQRLLLLTGLVGGGVLLLLIGLAIYFGTAVNSWWFLPLIILLPLALVFLVLLFSFSYLANRLQPRRLSRQERSAIRRFTDTILALAEVRATPWPLLVLLIGKDVLRGKPSRFIRSTVSDASGLKTGFDAIRSMFDNKA